MGSSPTAKSIVPYIQGQLEPTTTLDFIKMSFRPTPTCKVLCSGYFAYFYSQRLSNWIPISKRSSLTDQSHSEKSLLRWFEHLIKIPSWTPPFGGFPSLYNWEEAPTEDPELAGGIIHHSSGGDGNCVVYFVEEGCQVIVHCVCTSQQRFSWTDWNPLCQVNRDQSCNKWDYIFIQFLFGNSFMLVSVVDTYCSRSL